MSARARVHANAAPVVRPEPLAVAKVALVRAETELATREAELVAARAAEVAALQRFDDSGTDADLDAATRETRKRERAERVEERARDAVAEVRGEVARLERETGLASLADEKAGLAAWEQALTPHAAKVVQLYEALHQEIVAMGGVVLDALEARERADARAVGLGLRVDLPKPSIADAKLVARRAVLAARRADDLEDLTSWIETESISNWRFAQMTAAEVGQFQAVAKRAEAPAPITFTLPKE